MTTLRRFYETYVTMLISLLLLAANLIVSVFRLHRLHKRSLRPSTNMMKREGSTVAAIIIPSWNGRELLSTCLPH